MSIDPKKQVQEIVEAVGKRKAERLLVTAGVSSSMAGKLIRGKYESEIGEWIAERIAVARAAAPRAS